MIIHNLDDYLLILTLQRAQELNLDRDFIVLLEEEMQQRKMTEHILTQKAK